MNEQTLTTIQRKIESLFHRVEDMTEREYYLYTECWQYVEDAKADGNGERGMVRRALEERRHKSIEELYNL